MTTETSDHVTKVQIAAQYGVTLRTVERWTADERWPAGRRRGRGRGVGRTMEYPAVRVEAAVREIAAREAEPADNAEDYLTRQEIAERYGRSLRTVDDWCRAADWPAGRRRGRVMEYPATPVEEIARRRGAVQA
ncbi:MAG: hypothetical protein AUG49_18895 [Catenulispora sp. 13_1_20CM_3_70_7]|nr:MAG: hypothetical protein AUG49_18895 [Catenulispora sp. 13_1_20CM_3_70_7]